MKSHYEWCRDREITVLVIIISHTLSLLASQVSWTGSGDWTQTWPNRDYSTVGVSSVSPSHPGPWLIKSGWSFLFQNNLPKKLKISSMDDINNRCNGKCNSEIVCCYRYVVKYLALAQRQAKKHGYLSSTPMVKQLQFRMWMCVLYLWPKNSSICFIIMLCSRHLTRYSKIYVRQ